MLEDPVEILVRMAEKNEIDPWNIDIVEITDRFLLELETKRELDLRVSGRTLFYAATLLRIKSDYLEQIAWGVVEEDSDLDDEASFEDNFTSMSGDPIDQFEHEISRRLERKRLRNRPFTLQELILQLRYAEREERRKKRKEFSDFFDYCDAEDVIGIAHDEGYRDSALLLHSFCASRSGECEIFTLTRLSEELGWSRIDVYIPLLFLMQEKMVEIWQDRFYSDLYIKSLGIGNISESMRNVDIETRSIL